MITLPLANVSNEMIIRLIECGKNPILSTTSAIPRKWRWRFLYAAQKSHNSDGELVVQYRVNLLLGEESTEHVQDFTFQVSTTHKSWRISFESPIRSVWNL